MKTFLTILALVIAITFVQTVSAQEVKREGNTFVQVSDLQQSHDIQTAYFYKIKEISYSIWITPNGRCYIVRLSKNGNPYKQYLNKDICLQICQEMNLEYKE